MKKITISGMFTIRLFKVNYFLKCGIRLWKYILQVLFISSNEGEICSCSALIKDMGQYGICHGTVITSLQNTKLEK